MKLYRVSELTGRTRYMHLPLTEERYYDFMCNHIDELPELNEEQLKFLMFGVTKEEESSCASEQKSR